MAQVLAKAKMEPEQKSGRREGVKMAKRISWGDYFAGVILGVMVGIVLMGYLMGKMK